MPIAIGSTWTGPDGDEAGAEPIGCREGDPFAIAQTRRLMAAEAEQDELRAEVERLRVSIANVEAESDDIQTARAGAEEQLAALRLELGETRSQLESAQRACEAGRNERDRLREAFLEIARATGAHPDVIPSVLADHAVTVIRHDAHVTARISSLVASHIVRTTGVEPALEGLGRIELALVDLNGRAEKAERSAERWRRTARRTALAIKPPRSNPTKTTAPIVTGSRWVRRGSLSRVAVVAPCDRGPGWVSYRYEPTAGYRTLTATVTRKRFRGVFTPARKAKGKRRKAGR
jgi:hypothetical protein